METLKAVDCVDLLDHIVASVIEDAPIDRRCDKVIAITRDDWYEGFVCRYETVPIESLENGEFYPRIMSLSVIGRDVAIDYEPQYDQVTVDMDLCSIEDNMDYHVNRSIKLIESGVFDKVMLQPMKTAVHYANEELSREQYCAIYARILEDFIEITHVDMLFDGKDYTSFDICDDIRNYIRESSGDPSSLEMLLSYGMQVYSMQRQMHNLPYSFCGYRTDELQIRATMTLTQSNMFMMLSSDEHIFTVPTNPILGLGRFTLDTVVPVDHPCGEMTIRKLFETIENEGLITPPKDDKSGLLYLYNKDMRQLFIVNTNSVKFQDIVSVMSSPIVDSNGSVRYCVLFNHTILKASDAINDFTQYCIGEGPVQNGNAIKLHNKGERLNNELFKRVLLTPLAALIEAARKADHLFVIQQLCEKYLPALREKVCRFVNVDLSEKDSVVINEDFECTDGCIIRVFVDDKRTKITIDDTYA